MCNMGNRIYLVDYDIPVSPAREKVQFYRDLQKLGTSVREFSTRSVFRTQEEYLARAVYLMALAHGGNVHMYVAEEVVPDF
jgi:hypothetical protein